MIQAVLSYQFLLNMDESGDINPEFKPIALVFNSEVFSEKNYSNLINELDIYGIFYSHVTARFKKKETFGNYYMGRLRLTPYQVISHFYQEPDKSQFLTIAIFELDDELEIYENIIKKMGDTFAELYSKLRALKSSKDLFKIEEVMEQVKREERFIVFQAERVSQLKKIQKAALIFNGKERRKILELLRIRPISKRELKTILEHIKPNPNIDILIKPFLELRLIRSDWIKGEEEGKVRPRESYRGEYLFLTKDLALVRLPSTTIFNRLKGSKTALYNKYKDTVEKFFKSYDPSDQSIEELKKISNALLNPDVFDFYTLMKNNCYPLKKIPKILSEFVDFEFVINTLEELDILVKLKDKAGEEWLLLLTEIEPMIFFPEYMLERIKETYREMKDETFPFEVVKRAFELLEVSYPEKVEF